MHYGITLLEAAIACAGSGYKLAHFTGIREGHISEARRGIRGVPAGWVYRLAVVAGVDPGEAIAAYSLPLSSHSESSPLVSENSSQAGSRG